MSTRFSCSAVRSASPRCGNAITHALAAAHLGAQLVLGLGDAARRDRRALALVDRRLALRQGVERVQAVDQLAHVLGAQVAAPAAGRRRHLGQALLGGRRHEPRLPGDHARRPRAAPAPARRGRPGSRAPSSASANAAAPSTSSSSCAGIDGDAAEVAQRALRERRERRHALHLVAEQLDPDRLAAGGREDVDDVAAGRHLAALVDGAADALVARTRPARRAGRRARSRRRPPPAPARCASRGRRSAPPAPPPRRRRCRRPPARRAPARARPPGAAAEAAASPRRRRGAAGSATCASGGRRRSPRPARAPRRRPRPAPTAPGRSVSARSACSAASSSGSIDSDTRTVVRAAEPSRRARASVASSRSSGAERDLGAGGGRCGVGYGLRVHASGPSCGPEPESTQVPRTTAELLEELFDVHPDPVHLVGRRRRRRPAPRRRMGLRARARRRRHRRGASRRRRTRSPSARIPCGREGAPHLLLYGHYDVQTVAPLDAVALAAVRAGDPRRLPSTRAAPPTTRATSTACSRPPSDLARAGELRVRPDGRLRRRGGDRRRLGRALARRAAAATSTRRSCSTASLVEPGWPLLTIGVRGVITGHLRVTTGTRDVHSGLYGGAGLNAAHVLSTLIDGTRARDGLIPAALRADVPRADGGRGRELGDAAVRRARAGRRPASRRSTSARSPTSTGARSRCRRST